MKNQKIVLSNGLSIEASESKRSISISFQGKQISFTQATLSVMVEKTGKEKEYITNFDLNDLLLFKLYEWKRFKKIKN